MRSMSHVRPHPSRKCPWHQRYKFPVCIAHWWGSLRSPNYALVSEAYTVQMHIPSNDIDCPPTSKSERSPTLKVRRCVRMDDLDDWRASRLCSEGIELNRSDQEAKLRRQRETGRQRRDSTFQQQREIEASCFGLKLTLSRFVDVFCED